MAIYRVNKTKDYTTIANYHLREKDMSLKAKGLLTLYLSLSDDWNFSAEGIASICMEHKQTINKINQELEKFNYLKRVRITDGKGRFKDWQYDIYEQPLTNLPQVEKPLTLNTPQLNTKELNTNKRIYKEDFGIYKRIKLTKQDYENLCNEFTKEFIDNQITLLDEYVEINNNKQKYSNFNLVLRKSIREDWFKNKKGDVISGLKEL